MTVSIDCIIVCIQEPLFGKNILNGFEDPGAFVSCSARFVVTARGPHGL